MKKLILIRHGDAKGDLTEVGKAQMALLAKKLKSVVEGTLLIFSSTARRAVQSAEILSQSLGVLFETHDILKPPKNMTEDFPKVLELIRSRQRDCDILIVVVHLEYIEDFPSFFYRDHFGINPPSYDFCNMIIDCETGTLATL